MRLRILSALLITVSFVLSSCAPEHSKVVVSQYDKEEITLGDFESIYAKNAGGLEAAKKDSIDKLRNFLDLYVNFRMKLTDAKVKGLDKDPGLVSELQNYKEQVGVSYLIEKEIVDPGVKNLYDKRKYELRVSHIMIRPDTMSDQKAEALAESVLDRINKGESYEEMAKMYSADPNSKDKGGDIYYITGGQTIPEFEDAAYATPVGKVFQGLVKTRLGYHIIKVTEKRERVPQVKASHILVEFKRDSTGIDTAATLAKIKEVQNKLKNGGDFAKLAQEYSDDPGSKTNGGSLGFFERGMMVREFDEPVFKLKAGEISDIVKTSYGFHIIKIDEAKPYPSFEDEKENLKKLYRRFRFDVDYARYVENLKKNYKFQVNNSTINLIASKSDSTKVGEEYWQASWRDTVKDAPVYSYSSTTVVADSFFKNIQDMPDFSGRVIDAALINNAVQREGENSVLKAEALTLESRDPQFAALMDDYKNGIYIFKLQEDEVWNKIKLDSLKLVDFYEKNKEQYRWPDRVEFQEIYTRNDSLANVYYNMLQKGTSFDSVAAKYTERTGYKEKAGHFDLTDVNANDLTREANRLDKTGSISKPFRNGAGYSIVKLVSKDPARIKTFEEARAEVSGQFQEAESKRLENEYLASLKEKYKPVIFYDKLEKAFKSN